MASASFIVFALLFPYIDGKIFPVETESSANLQECVKNVIQTYFYKYKEVTYIDMNYNDNEIVNSINSIAVVTVLSRTPQTRLNIHDQSYFITAGNVTDFTHSFEDLVKEAWWNPHTRFLIVIKNLFEDDLRSTFDVLLKYHIYNVLVVNGSNDLDVYTYNPFKNFGCGFNYEIVINYGQCLTSINDFDLYPYKLETGLQNCTFRIASPHWPPYTFDPDKNDTKLIGIEEFVFKEISNIEKFSLNYSYSDSGEIYTEITSDMSAVGPLFLLQSGEADIIFGGLILTPSRAMPFDYIFTHLAYTDDMRYFVKKSTPVAAWKYVFLEFNYIVWLALFMAFVSFYCIFIILVRPKDRVKILFNMMASLIVHGQKIAGNCFCKFLFISWVWFAYLVNTYYQSVLMSLTTQPSYNYQISDEKDLATFKLKPCVSDVIRSYLWSVEDYSFEQNEHIGCDKLYGSISTVSQSESLFTVTVHSLYWYNEYSFYDEAGDPLIYTVRQPLSKSIYAMFIYKGFPMIEKLSIHALRLKENGLIDHQTKKLFWENIVKFRFKAEKKKVYLEVAWYVLICGYILSIVTYIAEILVFRIMNRRHRVRSNI